MTEIMTTLQTTERFARLADVDAVLSDLSRLLKKAVNCRWAVIYLLDRERRNFTPARSCGLPARYLDLFKEMPLEPGKIPLLRSILREKHYLLLSDSSASNLLNSTLHKLLGKSTLLAVPMVVRNQVTGVAIVARNRSYPSFSSAEIHLIRDLISHAALVVNHAMLFDEMLDMSVEMGKRTDVILTLDEINKAISSSLSRDKIIATAMQHIERIVQCELVVLLVEEEGTLIVTASHCSSAELPPPLRQGAFPNVVRSCAEKVLTGAGSCYIRSLKARKRLSVFDRSIRNLDMESLLAIPLQSREKTSGVLILGDMTPDKFQSDDVFIIEKIAAQIAVALDNARLYEEMHTLFINTVASLANAIDAKSPWTKGHSERVMKVAVIIAKGMGLDEAEVERIRLGGLLHDIGKIGIIEELLEKPARLSDDEFPPMQLHPEKGVAILAPIKQLQDVIPGILYHHERFDGSGYPWGLKGKDIPMAARIIGVADAFDAMLSVRPYKKGLPVEKTLRELERCAGSQFDPEVVATLRRCLAGKMKNRAEWELPE